MINGYGKSERKAAALFMNVGTSANKVWNIIGHEIEDMSRTMNNDVNSIVDVLGVTAVDVTKGVQTTTVDPVKFRKDSEVSKILYNIYKYNKDGTDVEYEFMEVFRDDVINNGYAAFIQMGAVDLKSWGGDAKAVNSPFDIHWKGERTHGVFNEQSVSFTPTTGATYLTTFSVAQSSTRIAGAQIVVNGRTIVTDDTGIAAIQLPAGTYPYTVVKAGYTDKSGSVTVSTSPQFISVSMTASS